MLATCCCLLLCDPLPGRIFSLSESHKLIILSYAAHRDLIHTIHLHNNHPFHQRSGSLSANAWWVTLHHDTTAAASATFNTPHTSSFSPHLPTLLVLPFQAADPCLSPSLIMASFDLLHVAALIGILAIFFFASSPLLSVYQLFLRPAKKLRNYGQYAIVTGATDGIGRAYAFQLAKQGMSLLLVSRTQERLTETENAIKAKYPKAIVKSYVLDASKFTPEAQQAFTTYLESNKLDIGVLLNNVGFSYSHPDYFDRVARESVQHLIDLNVTAMSIMTHIVLPIMLKKRKGCIVNIASFAALIPAPMLTQYSASKAYINNFTSGLSYEYANKGINFQAQCPLFVTSKLSKIRTATIATPTPETYAAAGIKAFGYETISIPYWPHALQNRILMMIPEPILARIVISIHTAVKVKAIKKKEREENAQGKTE